MPIAITEDHRTLGQTASDFLAKHNSRDAARALLEAETEPLPPFWSDLAELGWLGLHLPESVGGSGYGVSELVVVVEELGRALTPGPFVPTVIGSAVIDALGSSELKARLLPGLADGSVCGGVGFASDITVSGGTAAGTAPAVLGGGLANVLVITAGDDAVVVDASASGVTVEVPANLDPTRRTARVTLQDAPVEVIAGGARTLVDLGRVLVAAEAAGIATECTEQAAAYAKVRLQFGRPIAMFQAVKHHCANMAVASELATAAVWDAARAASEGGDQLSYAAAVAATLALAAGDECAQLNTQVHGGIAMTWEHDAHLYLRRATALEGVVDAEAAARDITDLVRSGTRRVRTIDLPPEAEPMRDEVRAFAARVKGMDDAARREALIETGYVMPHWPTPWGRGAGAVEQLVIEQEFKAAGVTRPQYSITGWVILTLIQHATEDQVARWVLPALRQEVIWCQLFSEPDAGSDAAGVKTRGTRVDGGWLVNGQKVWTSGAHYSSFGLATIRTDPEAPKHKGITTMVIDMHAEGVEVRPLRMTTGQSEFNEVFFNDVFVPDDDVIGPVNGGWTVARATLGNESVSIGGGQGGGGMQADALVGPFDAHPERLPGGAARIGRYVAVTEALAVLNMRSAHRAVVGGGPGPEGNVAKLVLSEQGHEASAILVALGGPDSAYAEGAGLMTSWTVLMHRGMSIAGGTSEIKRNQIGERILGLPRDPLIN
ncbi:MAG TPA: acyl-CoA dehydrogenase [Acidimicrobiales bacterium]|nr:acyl-CoA dehydrogenase [Acidimicrobiales bacterium]